MRTSGQAVSKVGNVVALILQVPNLDWLIGAPAVLWWRLRLGMVRI